MASISVSLRRLTAGAICGLAVFAANPSATNAQGPSAGAIAAAKELLEIKGAVNIFDPIVIGLVEQSKTMFLQTNPSLSRDLNEAGNQVRNDLAPRRVELLNEFARVYAGRFSEQELREIIAFYRTPVGKKMVVEEPGALEQSFSFVRQWQGRLSEDVLTKLRAEMKKKGHNL